MSHPDTNLAKSATQDAAAAYMDLVLGDKNKYDITSCLHHRCVLSVPNRNWYLTEEELYDLASLSCDLDQFAVRCFAVAHILGVHFRANEWFKPGRCGSVVTCVKEGQSYYARVDKFVRVEGDDCPGYACVKWFGKPSYPSGTPLVVKVGEDTGVIRSRYLSVIPITDIDPSRVMVEFSRVPDTYYVMRDSGYDTCTL